jgi:hypothetical protein
VLSGGGRTFAPGRGPSDLRGVSALQMGLDGRQVGCCDERLSRSIFWIPQSKTPGLAGTRAPGVSPTWDLSDRMRVRQSEC